MMRDEDANDSKHERLIDALLQAAYADERSAIGQRVEMVLRQMDSEQSTPAADPMGDPRGRRRIGNRWVSYAIAVSIVLTLVVGFQMVGPSPTAIAAIERSLLAAGQDIARRYLITVSYRDTDNQTLSVKNDLYVRGNDRFALRHPALLPGADLWLGKEGTGAWVVPSLGPVRTGDDLALSRWLSAHEDLPTPYLHITTVLDRMSRGYRLEELGNARIELGNGSQVDCRHVIGRLRLMANQKLPATIELWADVETGVAQRIVAKWNLSEGDFGRELVTLEFADQPDLPENFFRAEGHYSAPRRVIRLDDK